MLICEQRQKHSDLRCIFLIGMQWISFSSALIVSKGFKDLAIKNKHSLTIVEKELRAKYHVQLISVWYTAVALLPLRCLKSSLIGGKLTDH